MTAINVRGKPLREVMATAENIIRERADELWVDSLETLLAAGASQSEVEAERDEFYGQVGLVLDRIGEQIAELYLEADIARAITDAWRRVFDEEAADRAA